MKLVRQRLLLLTVFLCLFALNMRAEKLTWGMSAITLSSNASVSLGLFHRLGGANRPAMPTECSVAYNKDELLVTFRCREKDMAFPAMGHGADWYSQIHSPFEQDAAFPDKVDLYLSPDLSQPDYYQFAVTLDGQKFGVKRHAHSPEPQNDDEQVLIQHIQKVRGFSATVSRGQEEWTATVRIPWPAIGGKPAASFGLIPMRTRWRQGEVTSPVAGDFTDRPPADLFIEACFPGATPSKAFRWQRPATLTYPDTSTIAEIWKMEQTLSQPTDEATLPGRVRLLQRWLDLLTLEGFNYRPIGGAIVASDMSPNIVRRAVNAALRAHEIPKTCQLLDDYMRKLDQASRDWFADGSPGDIRSNEWNSISELKGVEDKGRVYVMHCAAGGHPVDLNLSLPVEGGFRLQANAEGFFKPAGLQPLELNGKVVISKNPFSISLLAGDGQPRLTVDPRQIAFRFDAAGKVLAVDFRNPLESGEVIYGFGEKYDRFNQNGNVLTLWGVDDWYGLTAGLENQSYKPIPVFHSSKGYSAFDNSTYRLRADIGKTDPTEYRLTQHGPILDYYFWTGTPEAALSSYTSLTGKPLLPPKWAFEPWMGRTGRAWGDPPLRNAVEEQERVIKKFASLDIPHSAIYAEGPGADSKELNDFAAARGLHVLSWANSCISEAFQSRLLPGTAPSDLPFLNGSDNYVDYSNPNAAELSRQWWAWRLSIGVAGSMVDFGDRTPEGAVFHDGRRGDEMHNFYSYDYQKTVNEIFHERRGDDFILFGRAAAPGTQHWAAQFAGDHPANFTGLQGVLTGALNLSACGFSTWGSDLGGFLGWPEPGVYMRWTEFACFSPLMRSHGRTPRDPWVYGDAALSNYKHYVWVRENLLDYIYDSAAQAHETGVPMMRSMTMAFPGEAALAAVDDQYMFGPSLLVAPVVTDENSRAIVFPPGQWASLWDGSVTKGPATVQYAAPLDAIPVFIKEGAAIPVRLNSQLQFGESMSGGQIHAIAVAPPPDKGRVSIDSACGVTVLASADGYIIRCRSRPETQYVLLDSRNVAEIRVDGHVLRDWRDKIVSGRAVARLKVPDPGGSTVREIDVDLVARHARR